MAREFDIDEVTRRNWASSIIPQLHNTPAGGSWDLISLDSQDRKTVMVWETRTPLQGYYEAEARMYETILRRVTVTIETDEAVPAEQILAADK